MSFWEDVLYKCMCAQMFQGVRKGVHWLPQTPDCSYKRTCSGSVSHSISTFWCCLCHRQGEQISLQYLSVLQSINLSTLGCFHFCTVGDVPHTLQSVGSESRGLLFISFPQNYGYSKGTCIHTIQILNYY